MKYTIKNELYFEPSFSFQKMNLFCPKTVTKNKLLNIKHTIYKKIFEVIKFVTDKMIEKERFSIENKKKILNLMDIHEDVDLKTLSKYYSKEYERYRQILSLGIKKSISYNEPYYHNGFNKKMQPKPKVKDFSLDFFKNTIEY